MVSQLLINELKFPDPSLADDEGLLATGGDLSAERLVLAYQNGIFPFYFEGDPILWFSPHERCVIFSEKIRISKSMKQVLQKGLFTITFDQAFASVIRNCAAIREEQDDTWITDEMQNAYIDLHQKKIAHSVEVWNGDRLVGGLYGVVVNNVFCGESMFSHESNASKAALIWLAGKPEIKLIDCQLRSEHVVSMGAEMISQELFLKILRNEENKI